MYGYEWTEEYGIYRLTPDAKIQKEIRPVFHEELDFFGMDQFWDYPKDTDRPLLWAEGVRRYVMNGVCVAEAQGGGFYTKPVIKRLTEERLQLRPIDTERLYEVNRTLMVSLEQKSIRFIREQFEKYASLGYAFVCAFSGGKDSLVLLDLTAKALAPKDFYVVFSNTGMELSDTLKAVEAAKKRWPQLRFEEARCHMEPEETWEEIGPPASRLRWCCSVHKSVPTVLLIQKLTGNNRKVIVFDGVRAEESLRRAKYEEVADGSKNLQQVNCHAILKWSTAEVFPYLLKDNILLNNAYRNGLYRVGCKVCPMSAKWQDSLVALHYPEELQSTLGLLEELTQYAKGKLDKKYIEDGGWQARTGGKILRQGENRVKEIIAEDCITFSITNSRQDWLKIAPIFGTIVEEEDGSYLFKGKHGMFRVHYKATDDSQTITVFPFSGLDRYDLSALRSIANKAAYCVGCKACIPQCPTGAFQIINGAISIRQNCCIHCYNCCMYADRGCVVAKSLHVRGDNMENPDRYRNFGFRRAFYEHFVDEGVSCFELGVLGKDQYTSLKQWLADAGMLKVETKVSSKGKITRKVLPETTKLADMLEHFGAYSPFPWAIMWVNLAYDSIVSNFYCLNTELGTTNDKDDIIDRMSGDIDRKYRSQAVNSLLSTFRDSPIGAVLKQGIPIEIAKNTYAYYREGWQYPDAVPLLYAMYLYGEKTGRKALSFTELMNAHNDPNAKGISPHDIFGIESRTFRDQLQGLAISYPKYIRVQFKDNLDNIFLEDYSSLDVLELAKEE